PVHTLAASLPTLLFPSTPLFRSWHPIFAQLLRPILEGHYEVRTTVPVGDLPREADIVLLHRSSTPTGAVPFAGMSDAAGQCPLQDRKSARLNSSHQIVSYAVFCV